MSTKKTLTALVLTAFVLLGASCSQKSPTAANTAANTPAKTTPVVTDNCGNPYYPFKPGLTIAYSVTPTTGAAGSSDYTLRVLSVSGTVAKIQAELFSGAKADMEADCASGAVALNGSSGLGAAMQGIKFNTIVVSSSGSSMPADVRAGATWSHSETVRMEVTGEATKDMAALVGSTITSTTKEDSKAIGEESVTVPAGTYKAMKIELTRTTTSEFSNKTGISLGKMPASTDTSTEWWVKGIGMVKTVNVNKDGTTTTMATSVSGN